MMSKFYAETMRVFLPPKWLHITASPQGVREGCQPTAGTASGKHDLKNDVIKYCLFCHLEGRFEMGLLSRAFSHSLNLHKCKIAHLKG